MLKKGTSCGLRGVLEQNRQAQDWSSQDSQGEELRSGPLLLCHTRGGISGIHFRATNQRFA